MTRLALALVVAAAALAPQRADARGCSETASVVGYQRCTRFGYFWSRRPAIWWETGATLLHLDRIGGADDRRVYVARGGTLGQYFGFSSIYLGMQTTLAMAPDGPLLAADAAPRGALTGATATSSVWAVQQLFVVGTQHTIGPITLGAELGPGYRIATVWPDVTSDRIHGRVAIDFVLDVHPRVMLWVHPHWTLGVQAGVDVVHPEKYSAMLFVGGHVAAYDKTR
jgi:hypothetical protein